MGANGQRLRVPRSLGNTSIMPELIFLSKKPIECLDDFGFFPKHYLFPRCGVSPFLKIPSIRYPLGRHAHAHSDCSSESPERIDQQKAAILFFHALWRSPVTVPSPESTFLTRQRSGMYLEWSKSSLMDLSCSPPCR